MKIQIHRFNKNQPWQWSWFERINNNRYEISFGRIWISIEKR